MTAPAFRSGAEAAEAASKHTSYERTEYFKLEDGEKQAVRFLTDAYLDEELPHIEAWITVNQHGFAQTKGAPSWFEDAKKWPKMMGSVCRNDPAFAGMFDDCFLCDNAPVDDNGKARRPSPRTWALACLRDPVLGDGSKELGGEKMKGKVIGYVDAMREVVTKDDSGKEVKSKQRAIVIVNMGWRNFFSSLNGFAAHHGTVLDRDYLITRSGKGTDTTYTIVPLDKDGTDVRDPETYGKYMANFNTTLPELITDRASDEFYARFFDTRFQTNKNGDILPAGEVDESGESEVASASDNEPDAEQLAAIMARIKG